MGCTTYHKQLISQKNNKSNTIIQEQTQRIYYDLISKQERLIKVITITQIQSDVLVNRASKLILLDHVNIIKIYGFQIQRINTEKSKDISLRLEMQVYTGERLSNLIGKLNTKQIQLIHKQLQQALTYIHSKKIIHNDIRSKNILIDKQRKVKLINFNFHYEQFEQQSDLYSLKIVLLELIIGLQLKQQTRIFFEDMKKYKNNISVRLKRQFFQKNLTKYSIKSEFKYIICSGLKIDVNPSRKQVTYFKKEQEKQKIEQISIQNNKEEIKQAKPTRKINIRNKQKLIPIPKPTNGFIYKIPIQSNVI